MTLPTAYTPLETLLLFQALRYEGVDSHTVFNRVSEQLNSIPIIRHHPSYDSGRLSPDALRALYLWLLKDEVKIDLERQLQRDKLLQNGDASPNSRKRKVASPSLPTVHEASQHAHLIPQLLTRLYVRYREHTVREIRDHEKRYEALLREIEEIEAGKWDERLQRRRTASATQSPRPSSTARSQQNNRGSRSPVSVRDGEDRDQSRLHPHNKIDSLINHETDSNDGLSPHRRNSSNTTLPPLSQMAPKSPALGIPPKVGAPVPGQPHGFNPSTSAQQPALGHPHGHPIPGPVASSNAQNSLSRPSSSPRPVLPPPSAMQLPPLSPVQQPHMSQHPQGMPAGEPSRYAYPPGAPPPSTGYYPHQPYGEQTAAYPLPQQAQGQPYSSHTGPYQMQPFPPEGQDAQHHQRLLAMQQQQQPSQGAHAYPQHAATAPSTASKPARPQDPRIVSDIIAALATPPRQMQRKAVWKSEKHLPPIKGGTPVPRPEVEPLSPVAMRSEPAGRSTRSTRNRAGTASEQPEEMEALRMPARSRGRAKRERSPVSVVSSNADDSTRMTRSQSVSTTAGAFPNSDDRPASRGTVKVEPSTPAGFPDEHEPAADQPSGGRMTRKRRGTLQSLHPPPQKRKRQESSGADHDFDDLSTPPPRSSTVTTSRNFHKLSATIMNDINSHKHASYFANPVRDRDAPGYSEIVHVPQHLKGIRAAISAGTRAVAAAAAESSPSAAVTETPTRSSTAGGAGGADGSTLELDRTLDLIPPRAIVNAAQLEKEVMRMFANAVMFNPGADGLVAYTREMVEDVEAKMREWRGAEKEAEGEEEEGKGKRRKVL